MKVLFAIGNEQTSKRIAEKYYEKYGEELEYKNVFYFKALLEEVKNDKTYDRIVIKEEVESFILNNVETIDRFIFNNIDNITDEIENSEIIFICSDRRTKEKDKFVEKLFNIGVYNVLIGDERSVSYLCDYIRKPMNKKDAKRHLNISPVVSNSALSGSDDTVEEVQILNILKYYENIKGKRDEYVPAFDKIAEQYSRNQLKIILHYLPGDVKEVIANEKKYSFLNLEMHNREAIDTNATKTKVTKPKKGLFGFLRNDGKSGIMPNVAVRQNANNNEAQANQVMLREKAMQELKDKKEQIKLKEQAEEEAKQKAIREAEAREQAALKAKAVEEAKIREQTEMASNEIEIDVMPQVIDIPNDTINEEQEALKQRAINEAKAKAEKEAFEKMQLEAKAKAEREAFEKMQLEAKAKAEKEAFEKMQLEAKAKAEREAFEKMQLEAKAKAEREAFEKMQLEAKAKAEREALERANAIEEERKKLEAERLALENEKKKIQAQNISMIQQTANYNDNSQFMAGKIDYKKMVLFVGANKSGTTFVVNAVAHNLSNSNVNVGVLDMTRDKSMYYLYNQDDKDLRRIASECMQNLSEGVDSNIPLGKYLKIYTSLPSGPSDSRKHQRNSTIIETVKSSNHLVIIDADFSTPLEYFEKADEIYIVQDLDIMKMQEATLFLRELKGRSINMNKIKIVINKYTKTLLTPKKLVQGLSYYNDPQMSFIDEILDSKVPYYIIPFDTENYVRYVDAMYKNVLDYRKFTPDFLKAVSDLSAVVYRRAGGQQASKRGLW